MVRLQIIREMRPLIVLRVRVCHRSRLLVIWATKETKTRFYGYSSHSDFTTTNPLIYAGRCSPLTTHATSRQGSSSELPKNLRPNTRIKMSILRGNQIKHKKLEADQKRTKALLQRKMDWVGTGQVVDKQTIQPDQWIWLVMSSPQSPSLGLQ